MNCYNFLQNEEELKKFHETVLPELQKDECFFLMSSARNKYLTPEQKEVYQLRKGSDMLKRVLVDRSSYDSFKRRVMDMCVPEGFYVDSKGLPLPFNVFTVYITPNPRSIRKALVKVGQNILETLHNVENPINLDSLIYSEVHKSIGRKIFLDADIDMDQSEDFQTILGYVKDILKESKTHVVKTHGGAHVLIDTREIDPKVKNTFYKDLQSLNEKIKSEIEFKSDTMVPLPGSVQGGSYPRMI